MSTFCSQPLHPHFHVPSCLAPCRCVLHIGCFAHSKLHTSDQVRYTQRVTTEGSTNHPVEVDSASWLKSPPESSSTLHTFPPRQYCHTMPSQVPTSTPPLPRYPTYRSTAWSRPSRMTRHPTRAHTCMNMAPSSPPPFFLLVITCFPTAFVSGRSILQCLASRSSYHNERPTFVICGCVGSEGPRAPGDAILDQGAEVAGGAAARPLLCTVSRWARPVPDWDALCSSVTCLCPGAHNAEPATPVT